MTPTPGKSTQPAIIEADSQTPTRILHAPKSGASALPSISGYEILGVLGRGGMGIVYQARHLRLERTVAIKMILNAAQRDPELLTRFRIESVAVAQMLHPNIVQLFEVGEHDGLPFCVLEYVEGGNLGGVFDGTPREPRECATMIETLARAIHVAHQQNILHRDLKPGNILVSKDGMLKITDFGLAKRLDDEQDVTQTGFAMGTPQYMSPEQASGLKDNLGPPCDLYALGIILYEALTGRAPFRGLSHIDTLNQVRTQAPVPVRVLQPSVPRDLETICMKCIEKLPYRRYQTGVELADDLQRFLDGRPILARPTSSFEQGWRWVKRHPTATVAWMLAILVLVFGTIGGGVFALWREAESARDQAVTARNNEITARETLDYVLDLQRATLAYRYWRENEVGASLDLLDEVIPERRGWEWRYVRRLSEPLLTIVPETGISQLAFSPDGSIILGGDHLSGIRVWDSRTGQVRCTLEGTVVTGITATPGSMRLQFSPDGRTVHISSAVGMNEWDTKTGKKLPLPADPERNEFIEFAISPDGKYLAHGFGDLPIFGPIVILRDPNSRKLLRTLEGHTSNVKSTAFSSDSHWLASGASDSTVRVWDTTTWKNTRTFTGFKNGVTQVAFHPRVSQLAAADGNGMLRVWDIPTGNEIMTANRPFGGITDMKYTPDGQRIAVGFDSGVVLFWDVATAHEAFAIRGHRRPKAAIQSIAFSSDGRFATASGDGTIKIWDGTRGPESNTITVGDPRMQAYGFSRGGRYFVAGAENEIVLTDTITHKQSRIRGEQPWSAATATADGKFLLTVGLRGKIDLWNVEKSRIDRTFFEPQMPEMVIDRPLFDPVFSHDEKRLAGIVPTGKLEGELRIWERDTGHVVQSFPIRKYNVPGIHFSPDAKRIAYFADDHSIVVSEIETGRELLRNSWTGPLEGGSELAFSPDGNLLITIQPHSIQMWDLTTGKQIRTLHASSVFQPRIAFSPDGTRLVAKNHASRVTMWDVRTWQETLSFEVETRLQTRLAFGDDGNRLMVATDSLPDRPRWIEFDASPLEGK